jgi:superfamily II DNA/RNA helicase
VSNVSLKGDYRNVRRGDCIVAFTKSDIFAIKHFIEKQTSLKCAVIYGQLPPEVRSMQAKLFNEGDGFDVLVASDAIGMGLNLNIRRVIFHTTRKKLKSISSVPIWVEPSSIKQIAGRAGRLSSQYKVGEVTSWQDADLPYVQAVMAADVAPITSAGIFPVLDQVQSFYSSYTKSFTESQDALEVVNPKEEYDDTENNSDPDKIIRKSSERKVGQHIPLSIIMDKFVELSKVDSRYFMCRYEELNRVSNWLHSIPLSIEDR